MNLRLDQWLLAQCFRADSVGHLARLWFEESRQTRGLNPEEWLGRKSNESLWFDPVIQARQEYAHSVERLANGKSSPTFRRLFISPEIEGIWSRSLAFHTANPRISPQTHLRQKHVELFQSLKGRKMIYLDTNHWVNLRHIRMKTKTVQSEYTTILDLLCHLVAQNKILCPLSYALFIELMKQSDENTREATAKLMQTLSNGVCIQSSFEIERLEIRERILRTILQENAPDLGDQIWTKVGYICGEIIPFCEDIPAAEMLFLQKTSIDVFWETPLEYFAEMNPNGLRNIPQQKLADATNADAMSYRKENLSFQEIFTREKARSLQMLSPEITKIAKEIWDEYPQHRDTNKMSLGGPSPWVFPSIQVLAGINATIFASSKNFTANDVLDLRHAALAIPYYDALFCDNAMAHLLRNKPLELSQIYQTPVLSRPAEILKYLQGL